VQGLLANGLRTSEIATIMGVSPRYIRKLVGCIRRKSGTMVPRTGTIVPPGTMVPPTAPRVRHKAGTPLAPNSPTPTPNGPTPRTRTRKKVRSSADPLVAAFKAAFVSRYEDGRPPWNWAVQMKHLKGLAKRCRGAAEPEAFAVQVLEAFWRLVQTGDKFWRSQPFSPMTLNSEGIFTRVVKSMTEDKGLDIDAIVDEALRRSKR